MESYIVFIFINLIIDYVLCLSLKQIFKLSCSKIMLFILQVINMALSVFFIILKMKFVLFIILKLAVYIFICLLITDSFEIKKLIKLYITSIGLLFSYFGFYKFFALLTKSIILQIFGKKMSTFFDLVTLIALLCYIFAIFSIIHNLSKNKNVKTFLRKVSFFAFGRHIEIMGLLDSGNVLYDTKTKLPVIVLCEQTLKKYLPQNDYENITTGNYSKIGVGHFIKAVSISNEEIDIPIIEIQKVKIFDGQNSKEIRCVLGLINHKFENSNLYDCLIHRDFI